MSEPASHLPTQQLFAAIAAHDLAGAATAIADGADLSAKNADGLTAIDCAVGHWQTAILRLLLAHGASLHARSKREGSLLYHATASASRQPADPACFAELVQLLREHGAHLNYRHPKTGDTALMVAMRSARSPAVIEALVASGALCNECPFNDAVARGDVAAVKNMIAIRLPHNHVLREGGTLLHTLVKATADGLYDVDAFSEVASLLLRHGAAANALNDNGHTALHLLARFPYPAHLEALLGLTVNPTVPNKHGSDALYLAASSWRIDNVRVLLARHPDPLALQSEGRTLLHAVAHHFLPTDEKHCPPDAANGPALVKLFCDLGVDPNATDERVHHAPLMTAIGAGNHDIVAALLAHGASTEPADAGSESPLRYAVRSLAAESVRHLVAFGCDPLEVDRQGRSLLHALPDFFLHQALLPEDAFLATLAALLDAGVSLEARDKSGETPLFVATRKGRLATVRMLLDAGADAAAVNHEGVTCAQWLSADKLPRNCQDVEEKKALLLSAGARSAMEHMLAGLGLASPPGRHRLVLPPPQQQPSLFPLSPPESGTPPELSATPLA